MVRNYDFSFIQTGTVHFGYRNYSLKGPAVYKDQFLKARSFSRLSVIRITAKKYQIICLFFVHIN